MEQQKYHNYIYDEIGKYIRLYNKNFLNNEKFLLNKYMKINNYFYTFFYYSPFKNERADFIYSNDFRRLFIGEVNGSKYKKTLLVNLNDINSFELHEVIKSNSESDDYHYYLKINYKNTQNTKNTKNTQIKMGKNSDKRYAEKFILLLNGKLNDLI